MDVRHWIEFDIDLMMDLMMRGLETVPERHAGSLC
jgi:hypothetical protein